MQQGFVRVVIVGIDYGKLGSDVFADLNPSVRGAQTAENALYVYV